MPDCKPKQSEYGSRRFLAVYDLSSQPYSIGDIIFFLQGALLKQAEFGTPQIDICFISDPARTPLDRHFANLMKNNNGWHNLLYLLPLVQFTPNLGNVLLLGSFQEFNLLLSRADYLIWPSLDEILAKKYMSFDVLHSFQYHVQNTHHCPLLIVPNALITWVNEYLQRHALPQVPVTVNLRNNPFIQQHRNSDIDAWLEFFDYCNNRYPVTFIVLCAYSEIDGRLRLRNNVVVAKDRNTSMEQDIALCRLSAFHVGAASGAGMWPVFTDKPYVLSNAVNIPPMLRDFGGTIVVESDTYARFSFSTKHQKIILVKDNADILIREFEAIWHSASIGEWLQRVTSSRSNSTTADSLKWLR